MASKVLAVLITVIVAFCTAQDCSWYQDNCSPDDNICRIDCVEGEDCAADDGAGCPTYSVADNPAPKYDEMTAEICEATCTAPCAFYRYEKTRDGKKCYLMNKDQCQDAGDGCNDEEICVSGPVDCQGGGNVNPPEVFTCPAGTIHTPGVIPDFYLHWNCFDTNGGVDFNLESATPAPGNTECTAKPSCNKNGNEEIYKYKCEEESVGSGTGKWKWHGSGTDPGFIDDVNGGKLKDATCNADALTLKDYNDQVLKGMEILCVGEAVASGSVPAQNSCILICDGYPILNFYTKMAKWVYTMMDEPSVEDDINTDDPDSIIYCHKP